MKTVRFLWSSMLLVGLLLLQGCSLPAILDPQKDAVSPMLTESEKETAREALPLLVQRLHGAYNDEKLQAYLEEVLKRLISGDPQHKNHGQVVLVNHSASVLYALPGGGILLSRGLLMGLENEAQLAAVLSHGLAHAAVRLPTRVYRHQPQKYNALSKVTTLLSDDGTDNVPARALQLASGLLEHAFTSAQEAPIDRWTIDTMVRAGYDPQGAVEWQKRGIRQVRQEGDQARNRQLLAVHPFSMQRLNATRDYVRQAYPQVNGRRGAKAYRRALESLIKTADAYLLYDQGLQLERSRQVPEALEAYHQAILKAPDQALIRATLGMAYLRQEDLVPARRYLLQAIRFNKKYFKPYDGLGYAYLQKGQEEKALRYLQKGVVMLPTVQGAFLLAQAYEKTGQVAKAKQVYQLVHRADPGRLGRLAAERAKTLSP